MVTADNTNQVTLSLSTNLMGATLSGGTATVSAGVATFANLSVSLAGNGYVLGASSGALAAAMSSSFGIAATGGSAVLETFNNGLSQYYYQGTDHPAFNTSTVAAHDGSYGLLNYSNADWLVRLDAAAQVQQGDSVSVWVRFTNTSGSRAYFAFGASAGGTLSLVAAPNSNQLLLQDNGGYNFTTLAAVNQKYLSNHWYRLEVDWCKGGAIVGRLYDSNGKTLLTSVGATDATITSGGFGFRAFGSNVYWDTVTVQRGVNTFTSAATSRLALAGLPSATLPGPSTNRCMGIAPLPPTPLWTSRGAIVFAGLQAGGHSSKAAGAFVWEDGIENLLGAV